MASPAQSKPLTLGEVVNGLDHITVPVRDLHRALRFYTEVLQMEPTKLPPSAKVIAKRRAEGSMRFPSANVRYPQGPEISMFEYDRGFLEWDQDHPHIAMSVPAEHIDLCAKRLRDMGIPFDGPSHRGPAGGASLYFNDPDGNKLEFHCRSGYTGQVEDRPPKWEGMRYEWPK